MNVVKTQNADARKVDVTPIGDIDLPSAIPYRKPDIFHTDAQSKPKRPDI